MAGQRLHGTIHATIVRADDVHDQSRFTGKIPFFGDLAQSLQQATGFGKGLSRMYATVELDKARIARTRSIAAPAAGNPQWNEAVRAYCAHHATDVVFSIMVEEMFTTVDTLFGRAYLPVRELLAARPGDNLERRLDVLDAEKKRLHGGPKIYVLINFRDADREGISFGGGVDGAAFTGVPNTFFSQRQACRVTLYQDAHVSDTFKPTIPLAGGGLYKPGRCWEDLFDAISNARHLVYVTGWSVFTEITLVREGQRPGGEATLGELLKRKAREGVRVLMLVWNDPSSEPLLNALGVPILMKTSDEETAKYFSDSGVQCVLCSRHISVISDIGQIEKPLVMTNLLLAHHQKTITVDQELPHASGRRHIISFLGGIDVCDGRYDTQSHSLFGTLGAGKAHAKDFHQPNFPGATLRNGGPRGPWHDVHCKIEGPAAWDVLHNFEQRWRKQGSGNGLLIDLVGLESTVVPSSSPVILPDDQEAWSVQVFRSIDDNSTLGLPATKEDAHEAGLVPGKHQIIERSIQDAYIHAIRAAKNFIYIENQYFIGSSFQWKANGGINPADVGALNLIPRELSLKIVRKIEAGERFTVYVVLPMWPEGGPTDDSVLAILDWQRRTMEMMYDDIGVALQKMKMDDADPRDYLTFFCLGNREVKKSDEYQPPGRPQVGTDYARAQKARRFMIYVHAKLMIVDDEYVIVGSANLNERSLDGARDSEIAMSAYQPHRLNTKEEVARGQVHGFRMSLWYEHLGDITHDDFLNPGSLACVQRVNKTADNYWSLYAADQLNGDLPGHLLTYPIAVNKAGTVSALKGFEFFPDTQAPVRGKQSATRGPFLTT